MSELPQVRVDAGEAQVDGATVPFQINGLLVGAPHRLLPRIDTAWFRRDSYGFPIECGLIPGMPAVDPVPPVPPAGCEPWFIIHVPPA